MSDTTITLDLTDPNVTAILTQVNGEVKSRGFYAAYVSNSGLTRDDVADHARAFADAWLAKYGNAADRKVGPVQRLDGTRTRYGNAVQAAGNGLRSALSKGDADTTTTKNLLTREGKQATREQVIAEWEAAQN